MKIRQLKRWMFPAVLLVCGLLFGGCGGNQEAEHDSAATEQSGSVYVPEYYALTMKNGYIGKSVVLEDQLYFCSESWDDEGQAHQTQISRYDFEAKEAKTIWTTTDETMSVYGLQTTSDGALAVLSNCWEYLYDEDGMIVDSKGKYEIWIINPETGEVQEKKNLTESAGLDEQQYINDFALDAEDYCYLYSEGDTTTISVLSPELSKVCSINLSEGMNGLFLTKEQEVYAIVWGGQGMELRKIDKEAKALAEPLNIEKDSFYVSDCVPGVNQSFLASDGTAVYEVDTSTASCETLFNWIDVDAIGNNVNQFGQFLDGTIYAITSDYSKAEDRYELIRIVRKNRSEVVQKTELTLGALWIGDTVKRAVIDFNKNNDAYHISVKEYVQEDYESGMLQFQADLASGNGPDLIDFSNLDYSMYAGKGVFEDLYPYMETSGMSQSDFLQNVLTAYEIDGKLYGMPVSFAISTIMGKQSVLGDIQGWTLSEMLDFMESKNPEEIFAYNTQWNTMYALVYNNINEFIDWETGECSFDGPDFARMLEYAEQLPAEYNYEEEEEGEATRLRKNTLYLMRTSVSSVTELQMYNGLFGETITYVGYPDAERIGNRITPAGGSLAISSKSENKDAAWSFVQTLLGEEYQNSLINSWGSDGFPVLQSALEALFEQSMTPEYDTDENGEQVERPKTTWGYGNDFEITIYAATEDEIAQIRKLIDSATGRWNDADDELRNIISEETEPFFKGQKSAAEVANVIQNRIQVYVNENR